MRRCLKKLRLPFYRALSQSISSFLEKHKKEIG